MNLDSFKFVNEINKSSSKVAVNLKNVELMFASINSSNLSAFVISLREGERKREREKERKRK